MPETQVLWLSPILESIPLNWSLQVFLSHLSCQYMLNSKGSFVSPIYCQRVARKFFIDRKWQHKKTLTLTNIAQESSQLYVSGCIRILAGFKRKQRLKGRIWLWLCNFWNNPFLYKSNSFERCTKTLTEKWMDKK